MHMIHGMGKIIQLTGPVERGSAPPSAKLLDVYRYLEATRAVSYGTSSTLTSTRGVTGSSESTITMQESVGLMLRTAEFSQEYVRNQAVYI